jgi:hypothetical protein
MYLIYHPEGSEEPTRWKYNPNKLMSAEREAIERRTSMDYLAFAQAVVSGNSLCRRALLFTFLKRENPKLRFEDVDFAWDELELQFSKQELTQMREAAADSMSGAELTAALDAIDTEIATAPDEAEPGKAS